MTTSEVDHEALNATIRYTMWSVFRLETPFGDVTDRAKEIAELERFLAGLAESEVVVRGLYDVGGLRADADLMIWWHAPSADVLQDAYHAFRRTTLGERLAPVWSQLGVHRPSEFNRAHTPAFMSEPGGKAYICVYPFVRSYDWYVLPEDERRDMLREHGMMARPYPDVRANTVSAFALGDFEWLLAFEADELHRIVDLMRDLRAAKARLHTREEIPFYTGRLRTAAEIVDTLP